MSSLPFRAIALTCLLALTPNPSPTHAQDTANTPPSTSSSNTPGPALLQFLDGSSLHGQLTGIETQTGVRWAHPESRNPIAFRPTNLAWIGFDHPQPVAAAAAATCRILLHNGDQILGSLVSLDNQTLELDSWLGGRWHPKRSAIRALTLLNRGQATLFEGPTGLDGWTLSKTQPAWSYRDGSFVASGVGLIGRDLALKGSALIEFDFSWTSSFNVVLILYTDVYDRFDYGANCYMFYLGPGYINAQRVLANAGLTQLGPQAQFPETTRRSRIHLEFRTSREEGTISVLGDGKLLQRWKDPNGFSGQGHGITFFSQMDTGAIKVSNLKVSEWDGHSDPESPSDPNTRQDSVRLANRDRMTGTIRHIRDGRITVQTAQGDLDVPINRVTHLVFAPSTNNPTPPTTPADWQVRAQLAGGGSVSLRLQSWTPQGLTGSSDALGDIALQTTNIRQLLFNLPRQRELDDPGQPGTGRKGGDE